MRGGNGMRLSITALGVAGALVWGGAVLFCGVANAIWPSYGVAFLQLIASFYPGYHVAGNVGSIAIGTAYAIVDGAVGGILVAWLYNRCARAQHALRERVERPVRP
jgi:hypothetical protein